MNKATVKDTGLGKLSLIKLDKEEIYNLVSQDTSLPQHVLDEMAVPTYLHKNPLIPWFFWKRYAAILQLAQPKREDQILEFGCGLGVFLPTLFSYSNHVFAIDLFPSFAKKLCMQRKIEVVFVDGIEVIPDNTLNTIIAADVMEHVDSPDRYFSVFLRKLKPGGMLVISGPTESFLYGIGRIVAGFRGKGGYHKSNIIELSKIAEGEGFVPEKCISLPFGLFLALFNVIAFRKPFSNTGSSNP